jgi:hypothetical protein
MTLAFILFGLLTFAVYWDDRLQRRESVLGEEWDFTQPFKKKKY